MDGFGFNPQYPPGSRVDSIDRPHSLDSSADDSDEYQSLMPRHQQMSLNRGLSERTVGMPSSAMTSRYAQIRSGVAGLADEVRSLGLALSPKESESLRSFLMLLDGAHVEALAQNLEELLMTAGIPADKCEDLKARVSLIRTRLQRAGKEEGYGFNDAQLLFTKVKDDLKEISKVLEITGTSSNAEKASVLGAFHQIQAIESKIAIFVSSAQDDYQPMVVALNQMLANLDIVELGLNSLNPVGTYGIVSSSVEHTVVEMPPCGKPVLTPPEICDLQRAVFDLRFCMGSLQQELGKGNMKLQVCRQQVSGIMGRLEALAADTAMMERATAEVQEKVRTGISLAQIVRGLSFLSAGICSGCQGLRAGLSKLFGHGQAWLVFTGHCCAGFTRLLNALLSGIIWSAKGFGYYAGVAMLTPVFLIKKLAEDDTPWWLQTLPVNEFPDLPEGMEVYDPLKNTDAFNAMYRYLTEHDFENDLFIEPEASLPLVMDSHTPFSPAPVTMMPQEEFTDSLQMHLESMRSLEKDFASDSIGTVHLAQESLIDQRLETTRLENEFERLSSHMTEPELSDSQQSLRLCRELVSSCSSRSSTPPSMPYDSYGPDGSFVAIDDEPFEFPGSEQHRTVAPAYKDSLQSTPPNVSYDSSDPDDSFVVINEESLASTGSEQHRKVVQAYKDPQQLSGLFKQAEDIHVFLHQQIPALGRMASEEELQLITVALERLKDQHLKEEARVMAAQAFDRRFHGRFKQPDRAPNMLVDRDEIVTRVQDTLVKEIDQVTAKLRDMLPREQMATDSQDWQFIKEKANLMTLMDTMKSYLDDASLVRLNLHYFTGHDLSESNIESMISDLNNRLEKQVEELENEKIITRARLESAERRLEFIDTKLSELKSKLADLYFEGWIGQDDPAFDQLGEGRNLVRKQRSKLLEHYEKIIEPDASAVRKRMHTKLKNLSEDLKQKLSSSGRRADIDRAVALLDPESGEWSKEKWLHLNWMCNQYSSMLRNTVYEDYATVNHMASSIGKTMQEQLQPQINAFNLCSTGDIENTLKAVWSDWERHHTDSMDRLLADPVLRRMHEGTMDEEHLFRVRSGVLYSARGTCSGLSRGVMRPAEEVSTVDRFYQDVLKHGAGKTAAFDRVIRTLDPKQYQVALQRTLERMKDMENAGNPCFPVIKMLAEIEDETPTELDSCGFDDIARWAEKKLNHFLGIQERRELMIMFMQFRDQLMKQMDVVN